MSVSPPVPRVLPVEPVTSFEAFRERGGGRGLERAVAIGPDAALDEVRRAGLRGRGGGGFPTARKWEGVRAHAEGSRYVVANGAEGEPGTFKDRAIMRADPYQIIEGVIIAGFVVGAAEAFVCTKAEYGAEADALERAARELQDAGLCETCSLTVVRGPDLYLFGEEKALLEVIEGKPPLPRLFPPYEHGLFAGGPNEGWESTRASTGAANPTVVNNVETLAHVSHILREGADWFRSVGTAESPGTTVCTVVGDVRRPGVAEIVLGAPLRAVIDEVGGGLREGSSLKAVLSGVANAVVAGGALDAPVSYEGLRAVGSGMGSAGFIAYGDDACMVEVARQVSRFLAVESCGQCLPCKEGSRTITAHLERLEAGTAGEDDLNAISRWLRQVTDASRCYLATQEQVVVTSLLQTFSEEVGEHLVGECPRPRELPFPKLVDLVDGEAVLDRAHVRKRPDWTFAETPVLLGPP
jgi:NADH-quinone oxidoreductase subunit F